MAKKWKIDENKELPLAIIEDTSEGEGVLEMGQFGMAEYSSNNVKFAEQIVQEHNSDIEGIVKISIMGGVADVVEIPDGIVVRIKDYDVEGFFAKLQTDEDGNDYNLSVYG